MCNPPGNLVCRVVITIHRGRGGPREVNRAARAGAARRAPRPTSSSADRNKHRALGPSPRAARCRVHPHDGRLITVAIGVRSSGRRAPPPNRPQGARYASARYPWLNAWLTTSSSSTRLCHAARPTSRAPHDRPRLRKPYGMVSRLYRRCAPKGRGSAQSRTHAVGEGGAAFSMRTGTRAFPTADHSGESWLAVRPRAPG